MAVLLLAGALLAACSAGARTYGAPRFIDTQAQFNPPSVPPRLFPSAVKLILKEMDRVGVSMTFIVPPPFPYSRAFRYDFEEIVPAIMDYPRRFAFLAGGGSLNPQILGIKPEEVADSDRAAFRRRAEEILAAGALGFGEMTAAHYSVAPAPYYATDPDHPLLLLLADIAAERGVPIDFHFDVAPRDMPIPDHLRSALNPSFLRENLVRLNVSCLIIARRRSSGLTPVRTRVVSGPCRLCGRFWSGTRTSP